MTGTRRATAEEVARIGWPRGASASERDWSAEADGEWWLILDEGPDLSHDDWVRLSDRIIKSISRWSRRRGMRPEIRQRKAEGRVWARVRPANDQRREGTTK